MVILHAGDDNQDLTCLIRGAAESKDLTGFIVARVDRTSRYRFVAG